MDEIEIVAAPSSKFTFFSGALKAMGGGKQGSEDEGPRILKGTASSTITDLHGDEMTKSALDDMVKAANAGLTIFLNHSYNVPEDVAGSVTSAQMAKRKQEDGSSVWDLDFEIAINEINPRAAEAHAAIKNKTKLGLSIGAMIPEDGAKRRKDGSYLIEHVNLLETSIVGIPANPRSWVQYAVKAIKGGVVVAPDAAKAATSVTMSPPKLTLDPETRMYRIEGSLGDIDISAAAPIDSMSTMSADELAELDLVPILTAEEMADKAAEAAADLVVPDVQDAKITIIEIDTGASDDAGGDTDSQEAPSSNPENEAGLADETATGDSDALGDDVTRSLQAATPPEFSAILGKTIGLLNQTATELFAVKGELAVEKAARMAAESDAKQVREKAGEVIRGVSEVIDKIARTPLKSRTQFVEGSKSFDHLKDIYDEEFLKMLEGTSNGK
jgi:HK97 family phage prohead protease